MRVYLKGSGAAVDLSSQDFVADGGQARVFARGGTAYKVYHDPRTALPIGKIQELAALDDPRVIRPQEVLVDDRGQVVGYTSRYVADAHVLFALLTKAFCRREGLTREMAQGLVRRLAEGISRVHEKGILVVDLNEMNFLVPRSLDDVFFIDTDSYKTPHYPCPVLSPSVRDWSVTGNAWTRASDWFSFGIVSFRLLACVHPFMGDYVGTHAEFRGRLPSDPEDDAFAGTRRRMQAHVSVFHPDVKVSAAAYPWEHVVPPPWLTWYRAIFTGPTRCPPPDDFGVSIVVLPAAKPIASTARLDAVEIGEYEGDVRGLWSDGMRIVVATDTGVWLDRHRLPIDAGSVHGCGFTPRTGRPVFVDKDGTTLTLDDGKTTPLNLAAVATCAHDGRIYVRMRDQVLEVVPTEIPNQILFSTLTVVNVLPHATGLYPGVVIQNMLGSTFVSLLSGPGIARQVRLKELDPYRVLDARYDGGVLMVVGIQGGKHDRLVFRFAPDGTYDVRVVPDVVPAGLNFVVLDTGVCVCMTEEEKLEVFHARRGSTAIRLVEDPILDGDAILGRQGGTLLCARGNKVYRLKMR